MLSVAMNGNRGPYRCLSLILLLLLSQTISYAGMEFEEWDPLPQMGNIIFSNTSVGFISRGDSRYFVLDRTTRAFTQLDKTSFLQMFPAPFPKPPYEEVSGLDTLRASNGKEFDVRNAYCAEGEDQPHQLLLDGKVFNDVVERCTSISAIEIIGNQLWLGTRYT